MLGILHFEGDQSILKMRKSCGNYFMPFLKIASKQVNLRLILATNYSNNRKLLKINSVDPTTAQKQFP
jgi:hypothetical protein